MMRKLLLVLVVLTVTVLLSSSALANNIITLNLDTPTIQLQPGRSYTFNATITADGGNLDSLFLNFIDFSVASGLSADDAPFFANFLPLTLNPGDHPHAGLFTITLSSGATLGHNYTGTVSLLGGTDFDAQGVVAQADFAVQAVSEPSSWLMLVSGSQVLVGWLRRRKYAA